MELIFDIIFEVFLDLYYEIAEYLLPNKQFTKGQRVIFKLLCAVISIINVVLVFIGVILILENNVTLGIILTSIGGALILIHILAAIFVKIKLK